MAKNTDDDSSTSAAPVPTIQRPDKQADSTPMMSVGGGQSQVPQAAPASSIRQPDSVASSGAANIATPPIPNNPSPSASDVAPISRPIPTSGPAGLISQGIGAMVNGVPTFSDATVPKSYIDRVGSSPNLSDAAATITRPTPSATFNGRTYSGAELDQLANTNVVPSASFTNPGLGTVGMPVSPDDGVRVAATNIVRPAQATQDVGGTWNTQRPGSYDPTEAVGRYRSDLADIINNDPRSLLGTAAHNAEADRIWNRNTANSRAGRSAADAIYEKQIGTLDALPQGVFDAQNMAGNANARNQTQFADTTATNATNLLRTGFETNARLTGAEARADALRYGADRRADSTIYAADSRGNAQRDVATTRANTPKIDSASTAAAGRIYQQALQDGKSPEDAHAAVQGWLQARQTGARSSEQQQPSAPVAPGNTNGQQQNGSNAPTAVDINHLRTFSKSNPMLRGLFDARFGRGASDRVLGPQQ